MTEAASLARATQLASQFEATSAAFRSFLKALTPQQWSILVPGEERTVAALAHHVGWAFGFEMDAFRVFAAAGGFESITRAQLDGINAAHGDEFAECTQAETLAYIAAETRTAAAEVRTFNDEQLGRSGRYIDDRPERTVEAYLESVLIAHIGMHERSIREAVGLL